MKPWLDLATEIIVVDSFSNDGTLDLIRRELSAYPLQIHSRPRGLYDAWNFGISRAREPWVYISTTGDAMTRDLLVHMLELGETHPCEVVMSSPQFVDEGNQPVDFIHWAIADILKIAGSHHPCALDNVAALYFAIRHSRTSALLGSSASNLYRTAHLQAHPFPVEFGNFGDGAWGIINACNTRFICTPAPGSIFRIHATGCSIADYKVDKLGDTLLKLALSIHNETLDQGEMSGLRIKDLLLLQEMEKNHYALLKQLRHDHRMWFFHTQVWSARRQYKQIQKSLGSLQDASLQKIRQRHMTILDCPVRQTSQAISGCGQ